MFNYATGSMGPNTDQMNNMYSTYRFGDNQKQYLPDVSAIQSSSYQFMTSPYSQIPSTLEYQSPKYTMHEYGISDAISHGVFGRNRSLGTNFHNEDIAKKEYRTLALADFGFNGAGLGADIGGYALGAAAFGGMGIASSMIGGLGVGAVIGAGVDWAKDEYFENHRLSQRVNGLTAGIRNKKGGFGLKGKDITDISKFIKSESAKDMLLTTENYDEILTAASGTSIMNSVGSSGAFKMKAKELAGKLKSLMDAVGSTDVKDLVGKMDEFSRMGFKSTGEQTSMTQRMHISAQFAGISENAMQEQMRAAVMNGKATGLDDRLSALNTFAIAGEMGIIQQRPGIMQSLKDKRTLMSAANEADDFNRSYNREMSAGVDMNTKIVYAGERAKDRGTSTEYELKKLMSKSISEQSSEVYKSMGKYEKVKMSYFDKNFGKMLSQKYDIGQKSMRSYDFANAVEQVEKMFSGKKVSAEKVAQQMQWLTGKNLSKDALGYQIERIKMYREGRAATGTKEGGIRNLDKGEFAEKSMASAVNIIDMMNRRDEESHPLKKLEIVAKKIGTAISSNLVGGFAESVQDKAATLSYYLGGSNSGRISDFSSLKKAHDEKLSYK